MILKTECPKCKLTSFILDGKTACCDVSIEIPEGTYAKRKRESETEGRRRLIPRAIRREILRHQNHQCVYCGISLNRKKVRIEFDHFVPFCESQNNNKHNFVASCSRCNSMKSALIFNSIEEARIYIYGRREEKGLPIYLYCGGIYEVIRI